MPGQQDFQGMQMPAMPPGRAQLWTPGQGPQEDIKSYAPPPLAQVPRLPNLQSLQMEQGAELIERVVPSSGFMGRAVSQFKQGYQARLAGQSIAEFQASQVK